MAELPADPTVAEAGQFPLLDRFPEWLAGVPAHAVLLGPGDDAALLRAEGPVAFTTDAQIEGTHFRRDWCAPGDVGWRALAAAASDVAAMGGTPLGAVVALAVPATTRVSEVRAFSEGLQRCALAIGCPVVGGNFALAHGGWQVVTSVLGTAGPPWLRSGATPGDALWVTGWPGRAHAGWQALAHGLDGTDASVAAAIAAFRRPMPRFAALPALLSTGAVHAAIDLSDGLSRCAERLAGASGVRLAIEAAHLPADAVVGAVAAACGADAQGYALHGGESYELLLAAPPDALEPARAALTALGIPLAEIGRVEVGAGVVCRDASGERPLPPDGFAHFGGG